MKTLVVYDTRHGFTQRCVEMLQQEVPELEAWAINTPHSQSPELDKYEQLILGGPVYFGRYSRRLVQFVQKHQALLKSKVCRFFVVGLSPRAAAQEYVKTALGPDWEAQLGQLIFFGGAIQWEKLTWWEKWLLKTARHIETDASNFDLQEVQKLVSDLRR